MSAPDYNRTAVTMAVEKGYGGTLWRNECPVSCGWHGSEWTARDGAVKALNDERDQHLCLRAPAAVADAMACLDEATVLLRLARDANEERARLAEELREEMPVEDVRQEVNDRRMELADRFMHRAEIGHGLMLLPGAREEEG